MKCAHNGIATVDPEVETAQVEAMEAELAADQTADGPESGGRRREVNLQPPASGLQPAPPILADLLDALDQVLAAAEIGYAEKLVADSPELVPGHYMYYVDAGSLVEGKGYRPSIVIEGVAGHYPNGGGDVEPWYWGYDLDKAQAIAKDRNKRLGLTNADMIRITASSMTATA